MLQDNQWMPGSWRGRTGHLARALALVLALPMAVFAQDKRPGQIHDYPRADGKLSSRPHQLAFELPNDEVARAEFRSDPFYAIILRSGPRCSFDEAERQEAQSLFPRNQVFFERFDCPDGPEDMIYYSNVNSEYSFMAVYGGRTRAEARGLFEATRLDQTFPGANIRKMQAILAYP